MKKFNLKKSVKEGTAMSLRELKIKQLKANLLDDNYMRKAVSKLADKIMMR